MQNLDFIAKELFDKVRGRFPTVTIGDAEGNVTNEPEQARYFDFDFVTEGRPVGKVSISLDGKHLAVVYGKDLVTSESDITKGNWYEFLKELRMFAKKRMMTFDTRDITKSNLNSRDYKFLAANRSKEEQMSESKLYGTSRTSYQNIGTARLMFKHSEPVNQDLPSGRSQHIGSIYIESADGERFKYPYRHVAGARAMARHVAEGGKPFDDFGTHITGLSEELNKLRKFKTYMNRSSVMAESLAAYMDVVNERIQTVKKTIDRIQKPAAYKEAFDGFETPVFEEVPNDVRENWIDELTIKQFNEELADVFPYIYKLVSENTRAQELGLEDLIGEAVAKIACVECDEVSTAAAWNKNNNFCPKCKTSNKGVAEGEELDESGLQYYTGVKKHGKEYMKKAAQAGREGASQEELGRLKDKYSKAEKKTKEEFELEQTFEDIMGQFADHMCEDCGNPSWRTLAVEEIEQIEEAEKKGLYYYVNKRKKAGTSRPKGHSKAPSDQDWKNAAKTAKESFEEETNEEKQKGLDGKVCWKGYKRMGTKMKGGKRVDNCVKIKEEDGVNEESHQFAKGDKVRFKGKDDVFIIYNLAAQGDDPDTVYIQEPGKTPTQAASASSLEPAEQEGFKRGEQVKYVGKFTKDLGDVVTYRRPDFGKPDQHWIETKSGPFRVELGDLKKLDGKIVPIAEATMDFSDKTEELSMWLDKYDGYRGDNGDALPMGWIKSMTSTGVMPDGWEAKEWNAYQDKLGKDITTMDDAEIDAFLGDPKNSPITSKMFNDLLKITGTKEADEDVARAVSSALGIGEAIEGNADDVQEAYVKTSKDAIDTLGALRKIGKSIERGQGEYEGNLANMYVNDVYDVISWLENNANTNDSKFKQVIEPVIELRKKAKGMETKSGSGKDARFGNEIVNTLYPLMQWIEMNVEDPKEGNAYANAVRQAKKDGKKKGDKVTGPDGKEITLEKEQQIPLSEFILSYFDRETGQFPKGETAVLTMIEKDYGEQYIEPAKKFIEMINNKMAEMYGYKEEEQDNTEFDRIRSLAGLI